MLGSYEKSFTKIGPEPYCGCKTLFILSKCGLLRTFGDSG